MALTDRAQHRRRLVCS